MINVSEIRPGDIFSEISHYTCIETGTVFKMKHSETGEIITLSNQYVQNILQSADIFTQELKVGREDKFWTAKQVADATAKDANFSAREGDVRVEGIRSIFEGIRSSDVFTVCFVKQDKALSQKAYETLVQSRIADAVAKIEAAKNSKKSVTLAAEQELRDLVLNPILNYTPGEQRVLRGYKMQFVSRDGRYDCFDVDVNELRPVNINTIVYLIYKGIKYTVE